MLYARIREDLLTDGLAVPVKINGQTNYMIGLGGNSPANRAWLECYSPIELENEQYNIIIINKSKQIILANSVDFEFKVD